MSEKIYLNLLFFFGTLCQVIFAASSDQDTRLSDVLVRNRRVINHSPCGRLSTRIEEANYLVKIKEENHPVCAGAILSHHIVITAALCMRLHLSEYKVYSGGAYDDRSNSHNVISSATYYGRSPPHESIDGIALLTVNPPFVFSKKTGYIKLHAGFLTAGTDVTVYGWGYAYSLQPGTESRFRLRTITLPIMNHGECRAIYQGHLNITEKQICTYHPQQYCARNDEGAPLIFNRMVVGIYVSKGQIPNRINPDIFINLQRTDYSEWIREHTLLQ